MTRQLLYFGVIPFWLALLKWGESNHWFPPGVLVSGGEVLAELMACAVVLASRSSMPLTRLTRALLLSFFLFLAAGDTAWAIFYFVQHQPSSGPFAILTTRATYNVAFILCLLIPITALRSKVHLLLSPILPVSLMLFMPIAARFIIVPFASNVTDEQWPQILVQSVDVVALIALAVGSLALMIQSDDGVWSMYGASGVCLVLGDWSTQIVDKAGRVPQFDSYEFLWAFGVCACVATICGGVVNRALLLEPRIVRPLSILKTAFLAVSFAFIVVGCMSRFGNDVETIRFILAVVSISIVVIDFGAHAFWNWLITLGVAAPEPLPLRGEAVRAQEPRPRAPAGAWERVATYAFGGFFVVIAVILAVKIPNPTPSQLWTFRVVLALAAAAIGSMLPRFMDVRHRGLFQMGGGFATFLVVLLFPRIA